MFYYNVFNLNTVQLEIIKFRLSTLRFSCPRIKSMRPLFYKQSRKMNTTCKGYFPCELPLQIKSLPGLQTSTEGITCFKYEIPSSKKAFAFTLNDKRMSWALLNHAVESDILADRAAADRRPSAGWLKPAVCYPDVAVGKLRHCSPPDALWIL